MNNRTASAWQESTLGSVAARPCSRRAFVGGTLAAGALAALAGCGQKGGDAAAGGAAQGGTMRYFITNPVSIDPFDAQENMGVAVEYQLFDSLMQYDFATGELKPLACESYDENEDATEFTFHLKQGTKFHNGDTVVAADWKRGWERIVDPRTNPESPSAISYHLAMVEGYDALANAEADELVGVTCPDDNTLVVKLSQSYADFPYVCSHPSLVPVPAVALDDFQAFFRAPIGNGPFKMDGKWEDGQYINIVRFDDYYGDKAVLDGVNFVIQKDVETAYREFQAGNLDFSQIPISQFESAANTYGKSEDGYTATPGHQVLDGSELSTYYLIMNNKQAPFDDVAVRRAVSLAINRQAICDSVFHGSCTPADNFITPGVEGYEEGAWAYSAYDPERAKQILDEAGYPADENGNRGISVAVTYDLNGDHKSIMDVVMNSLAEVGITAEADTGEWATIVERYHDFDYQCGRLGWVADYPITDNFLYPCFCSESADDCSAYANPEVDAGIHEARAMTDDAERVKRYQEINRMIGDDCPVAPIFFYNHSYATSEQVASFTLNAQMMPELDSASMAQ